MARYILCRKKSIPLGVPYLYLCYLFQLVDRQVCNIDKVLELL